MKTTNAINTGIEAADREKVAAELAKLLADTYSIYLKTHNFHWNVTGPQFQTLHTMFETHYNELALAVDEIAERIRALGVLAPGSYQEFKSLTAIEEHDGKRSATEMIEILTQDHETIVRRIREFFPVASEAGDNVTEDLFNQRMTVHEKTAWMLRSLLG